VAGQHSFRIDGDGFKVFPRLETTLPDQVAMLSGRANLGVDGLDKELGGGVPRGDSILLLGPSGVGKTMLALQFTRSGLELGESCLYVSFQESEDQLLERAAGAGWDMRGSLGDGLVIRHVPPVEIDLDEVGTMIRDELARRDVQRVVLDSLAELAFASQDTDRLPGYIWALTGFVRAIGGTTLFTNEIESLGRVEAGRLSFLFDDVVFLRYVEIASELRRGVNVLKMRRSRHGQGLIEFAIDEHGVTTRGEITGLSGLLGWSALRSDLD
jgi:circadian clock protein KaiC